MYKAKAVGYGLTLLAIGGALFKLASLERHRPSWIASLPDWLSGWFLGGGTLMIVLGILLLLSTVVYIPVLSKTRPGCRPVEQRNLHLLHRFSEKYFPGSISLNETVRLSRLNRDIFWAVWRERESIFWHGFSSKVIGFFSIVPVNVDGKHLLDNNKFSGEHLTEKYILNEMHSAAAIYLGGVAAGIRNRGAVFANLVLTMMGIVAEGHRHIYTRPTTKDGLKRARLYGFVPVGPEGLDQIYQLDQARLSGRFADAERPRRVIEGVKRRRR